MGDPSQYTDYQVLHNPDEWKYVERLMPMKWIPDVKPKQKYSSGWVPQKGNCLIFKLEPKQNIYWMSSKLAPNDNVASVWAPVKISVM